MRILLLTVSICAASAFQLTTPPVARYHRHGVVSSGAKNPLPSYASPSLALSSAQVDVQSELVPRKMDEALFKFNKIIIDTVYNLICLFYPVTGSDRDFARFFVLETVARVPYFAYVSVLHLRETFGDRDNMDLMRVHYAEADNELHHLLIMEELGGNSSPVDRALAQTMAFFYYWYVVIVYFLSEPAAYHLSELIEDHAFDTYSKFLLDHGELLKTKPVPKIAHKYYEEDNPYMFDTFCTVKDCDETGGFSERRPKLQNLYDVFVNIRDDEKEHWKTLCNLVQFDDMQAVDAKSVRSTEPLILEAAGEVAATADQFVNQVVALREAEEAVVEAPAAVTTPAPATVAALDLSIPYDAPAQLAYSKSDKSMSYPDFKTKYEADAVADVIAKKKAVTPAPEAVIAAPVPATVAAVDLSIPYDAPAQLAYSKSDKSMSYPDFKAKYEADAVADVIAKKKA